jgi:hypothetical protein
VHYVLNKPFKLRLLTIFYLLKLSSLQENVGIVHKSLVLELLGLFYLSVSLLLKIEKLMDLLFKSLLVREQKIINLLLPLVVLSYLMSIQLLNVVLPQLVSSITLKVNKLLGP